jgi:hypothetical protein
LAVVPSRGRATRKQQVWGAWAAQRAGAGVSVSIMPGGVCTLGFSVLRTSSQPGIAASVPPALPFPRLLGLTFNLRSSSWPPGQLSTSYSQPRPPIPLPPPRGNHFSPGSSATAPSCLSLLFPIHCPKGGDGRSFNSALHLLTSAPQELSPLPQPQQVMGPLSHPHFSRGLNPCAWLMWSEANS